MDDNSPAQSAEKIENLDKCQKLAVPENISAYLNKQELVREVIPLTCNENLIDKVSSNYIIVKQILSNLPWQDKLLCKSVCSTWHSAVTTLHKEQVYPQDFIIDIESHNVVHFKRSGNFYAEPLVVLAFGNTTGFSESCRCSDIIPCPCTPSCSSHHSLLDVAQHFVCMPKDCMLSVKASFISYMPLPHSITYKNLLSQKTFNNNTPLIGGVYIPTLPDVKFHMINIKSDTNMKKDFFGEVDKLVEDNIIKGILVYVTEKYLLHSVEDIVFLNYFKEVQPDIPYALAGCMLEDATYGQTEMIEAVDDSIYFLTDNLVSIAIFTVPKNIDNISKTERSNFNMYSLVVESSDWVKSHIVKTINEFANKVPQLEHSVVLKLSCVGRTVKHKMEQEAFRAAFPNTRLIGCYGTGELGINHPMRNPAQKQSPNTVKRLRLDSGPHLMYSYSTVFLYFGWGKMTPPSQPTK